MDIKNKVFAVAVAVIGSDLLVIFGAILSTKPKDFFDRALRTSPAVSGLTAFGRNASKADENPLGRIEEG